MKIKGGEKRGNNRAGFDVCVQSLQSFRFNLELKKKSTLDLSPTCRTLYFFLCELASAPFLYLSFIPQQASVCLSSFLSFVLSFSVFSFPPPPAFLSQREDTFPCIPHDTGHQTGCHVQDGRYLQVLTNAVGMREYGTLVTLSQESVEGS